MTDEEWLAAYLMQFGTATISNANVQKGEAEFLIHMQRWLVEQAGSGPSRGAWAVIRDTYERRMYVERTPEAR